MASIGTLLSCDKEELESELGHAVNTITGGGDSGGSTAPESVTINSLTLTQWPTLDDDDTWDTGIFGGGEPDIFFKLYSGTSLLFTSEAYEDCESGTSKYYTINEQITDLSKTLQFSFYDEDSDVNDLMGTVTWYPSTQNSNYSSSYTCTAGSIKFTLSLTWHY